MADYYDAEELESTQFDLCFDIRSDKSKMTISNGMMEIRGDIQELFDDNEFIHGYFNPKRAIEHMSIEALEELRSLIAPEVERINVKENLEHRANNRRHWEQLNDIRTNHRKEQERQNKIHKKCLAEMEELQREVTQLRGVDYVLGDARREINDLYLVMSKVYKQHKIPELEQFKNIFEDIAKKEETPNEHPF